VSRRIAGEHGADVLTGRGEPYELAEQAGSQALDVSSAQAAGQNAAAFEIEIHGERSARRRWVTRGLTGRVFCLLLGGILVIQAALSLQLTWTNTAFEDEALYLWAGHLEWSHWLHGTSIPKFADYFSGAPVIYPPIGALADSIGGLAAARMLSLAFMLGATCLLWATASRLYGRYAGFFAAATWVVLGPTIRLGAFATYDAMALFLIVFAAWCATARRTSQDATAWMLAGACALALANATKYATAIFDPVVIAMAVFSAAPNVGKKAAARRGGFLGCISVFLLVALIELAGGLYVAGIDSTTLARAQGGATAALVLKSSWDWIGAVAVIAVAAAAMSYFSKAGRRETILLAVLAGATLLVPIEQARIRTYTSLDKHTDFGAWFGAIAVGFAAQWISKRWRPALRIASTAIMLASVGVMGVVGTRQASGFYDWPGEGYLVPVLQKITGPHDRILADNSPSLQYYLADVPWQNWSNVYEITVKGARRSVNGNLNFRPFRQAIAARYFNVIVLAFTDKPQLDVMIATDLSSDPDYRFVGDIAFSNPGSKKYFMVWQLARGHEADR
jgi:hypothetical protein